MGATSSSEPPAQPAFLAHGHEPPFAGIATFNRAEHTKEARGADLVVVGVPFDLGAINRPGARYGPQAIRLQSAYAGLFPTIHPWDEDLMQRFRVIDYGDVAVIPGAGAVEAMLEQTEAAAADIFGAGASL